MIVLVPIRQLTLLEIKSAMEVDAELQALATMIVMNIYQRRPSITYDTSQLLSNRLLLLHCTVRSG